MVRAANPHQELRDEIAGILADDQKQQRLREWTTADKIKDAVEESPLVPPRGTWLSITQAARKHGQHVRTVRRWVDYGWVTMRDPVSRSQGKPCLIDEHDVVMTLLNPPTKKGPQIQMKTG